MSDAPRRVRVTADVGQPRRSGASTRGIALPGAATRGIALPGAPVDEADAVYSRALRRSQLRLALGTTAGFVVVVATLAVSTQRASSSSTWWKRCSPNTPATEA